MKLNDEELGRPDAALRAEFNNDLEDPLAQASRVHVCRVTSQFLTRAGRLLWVGAWVRRDREREGVALLTEMGAELARGAVDLFDASNWYAAAAVVRQMVEVEYLMWLFTERLTSAAEWLGADDESIRKEFAPKQLRRLSDGRFRDEEYWAHCKLGGHPNPQARTLLSDHVSPIARESGWADLAQHLERLTSLLAVTAGSYDDEPLTHAGLANALDAIELWKEGDPTAGGIALPRRSEL